MRRARIAALLVVAATAAAPAAAQAKVAAGSYKGRTAAADPVGFRVDAFGRIYGFYFEGVRLTCTDGDRFDSPVGARRLRSPFTARYPVSATQRTWRVRVRNAQAGSGFDAAGRFSERSVNQVGGTFSVFARFDTADNPDPAGTVLCQSRKLAWSAARQVSRVPRP